MLCHATGVSVKTRHAPKNTLQADVRFTGCLFAYLAAMLYASQEHCFYTGFLKFTPHHRTGAKFVAQSKVNKLISQSTTSTGMGARSTSVRLRKGSAAVKLAFALCTT